jgi:hypothetical protein
MGGHGDAAVGLVVDVFAGALSTMRLDGTGERERRPVLVGDRVAGVLARLRR